MQLKVLQSLKYLSMANLAKLIFQQTSSTSFAAVERQSLMAARLLSLLAFLNFDVIFPVLFERLTGEEHFQSVLTPPIPPTFAPHIRPGHLATGTTSTSEGPQTPLRRHIDRRDHPVRGVEPSCQLHQLGLWASCSSTEYQAAPR
jgi:hypothetical protein